MHSGISQVLLFCNCITMKLLFLVSRFLDGGIDTVLVEYLNSLCRLTDHQITLAIAIKHNELEVYLSRLDRRVRVEYLIGGSKLTWYKIRAQKHQKSIINGLYDEFILNPIRRRRMQKRLAALAATNDVVIDFDCCHGSYLRNVDSHVRKLCFYHFSLVKEKERSPRRFERTINKFAIYDNIVLISDAMLEEARSICPQYADKFVRIYNPIDADELRRRADMPVDDELIQRPYMLAVERIEESQKDITTLVRAYKILCDKHEPVGSSSAKVQTESIPYLYIIGKGRDEARIMALIDSLQLGERVRLLGFKANPAPWIKNARLMVHSSKFEGLPTVLIEALLLGKTIISSDCPTGPREILDYGRAGILVEPGNAQAMADAIENVLSDTDLERRIRRGAAEYGSNFLPSKIIESELSKVL